jgi:hypothetical protein
MKIRSSKSGAAAEAAAVAEAAEPIAEAAEPIAAVAQRFIAVAQRFAAVSRIEVVPLIAEERSFEEEWWVVPAIMVAATVILTIKIAATRVEGPPWRGGY